MGFEAKNVVECAEAGFTDAKNNLGFCPPGWRCSQCDEINSPNDYVLCILNCSGCIRCAYIQGYRDGELA